MATLTIRNLPRDVHARLRVRAARSGRSMEAEVRALLAEAVGSQKRLTGRELQEWVTSLYGGKMPQGVVDDLLAERRREVVMEEAENE